VPHVTDEKIADCSTMLGRVTDQALRVQVLDGARVACDAGADDDAVAPGILGPGRMPSLRRDDYTHNGNDSYWLTNPAQPLEGFPRIIGDERTARTPRTRVGVRIVQQRLDGSDGGVGNRFGLSGLQDAVFNNRQYLGEQWRDELVALCRRSPVLVGDAGPVDVSAACPVLEAWDLRDDLGSRGALLFRRFASRALGSLPVAVGPGPWREPFDPADPVNTPRGLNTESPAVAKALADAVSDLAGASIPLDAPLGEFQYEKRGDERIPIHGGPGTVGVFNAINVTWNPKTGYDNVPHRSSFVQAVQFTGRRCPVEARTILTYSQSTNRASPFSGDQTRLFSRKEWVEAPFCAGDMKRHAKLQRRFGKRR